MNLQIIAFHRYFFGIIFGNQLTRRLHQNPNNPANTAKIHLLIGWFHENRKNHINRQRFHITFNIIFVFPILLSQRESLVTVKFFDPQIPMIFDISELPESKYAFSKKCLCVSVYVCMYVCVYVCMCVMNLSAAYLETGQRYQVYLWHISAVRFEVLPVQLYS